MTDGIPVTGEDIDVPTPNGVADAYLTGPVAPGRYPGVLMFMDVVGLRPGLKAMADRIAAAGYLVLVPNVFHTHARSPLTELGDLLDPDNRERVMSTVMPLLDTLDPDATMADTSAYLDRLTSDPRCDGGPAGITGYCMGGMLALHAAGTYGDKVGVMASFHGGSLATESPGSPHLKAAGIRAELYFAHADADPACPTEQQERLADALDEYGVHYRSEVYPGCDHGFTMSDSPRYNLEGARRHWEALLNLLGRLRSR